MKRKILGWIIIASIFGLLLTCIVITGKMPLMEVLKFVGAGIFLLAILALTGYAIQLTEDE